jgi:hypothetical protein
MISIGEDSTISLGGHGENRRSNLMRSKYMYIFKKMPPVSPSMMINVKQCMVRKIFLYFNGGTRK